MAIIAKQSETKFEPCPTGLHQAVCVDVVDLGVIEGTFNGKTKKQHKIKLVWQTEEASEASGKPYIAQRRYTCSLDEKASLRRDLESWRGRPFTKEELAGFDLEVLIGINCQINIMHESKNGETYANVTAIVPLAKGVHKIGPRNYVRVKDREENGGGHPPADEPSDDDPFAN